LAGPFPWHPVINKMAKIKSAEGDSIFIALIINI
jgi:hypothetical protein